MTGSIVKKYPQAVVIGCSAGGMEALKLLLPKFPSDYPAFIMVVQHVHSSTNHFLTSYLDELSEISVKLAEDQEVLQTGVAYLAPPNYHLLVEKGQTLALSVDERVNFSRPSIDVLFQAAARVFQNRLVGVVLTGANRDGCQGMQTIHHYGGLTIVQDPNTAESPYMPRAVLKNLKVDYVAPLDRIASILKQLVGVDNSDKP